MAMFTLPQMISRLTKGFVKFTGRKPDGLEKIKIKQEALERIKQQDKVVDMEGNVLDVTKPIIGGKQEGLERVAKTLEANQKIKLNTFKNLDDNKKLNADEIEELEIELDFNVNDPDGPDLYEAYPEFDGTAGSAKKILKDSVEYEQSMFEQYKAGKLDPTPKPVGSLDREIKESYNQAVREGRLQNIRLKDGRRIESEDDFREYIDELNEDNNFANGGRIGLKGGTYDRNSFEHKINELKAAFKRYKKGSSTGGRKGVLTFEQFAPLFAEENFAIGGRVGLKAGMNRRAFLKLMGGVGAGIGALKTGLLKLAGKGAASQAAKEIIKTPSAAGKPEWFDALVTKVINQGEDVTKQFATKDREVVHLAKIDDDATVIVYRDLDDGTVRVDVSDATKNVADDQGEAIVSMEVRGGQLEEGVKGKTPAEFEAVEADYRNYTTSPDGDYDTEVIENVVNNTKDLTADLTKVKMYAKGQKKPTIKEMMIQRDRAKSLKKASEDPAGYAADRGPDYDPSDYIDDMADDFASGGIARMLGE